jgi:hypothetical protein
LTPIGVLFPGPDSGACILEIPEKRVLLGFRHRAIVTTKAMGFMQAPDIRHQTILKRLAQSNRGDVLMEYVLLTVLIILPLIGGSSVLFDPAGKPPMFGDYEKGVAGQDFGMLGNSFVQLYRMVMSGVSLPLP